MTVSPTATCIGAAGRPLGQRNSHLLQPLGGWGCGGRRDLLTWVSTAAVGVWRACVVVVTRG